MPFIRKRDLIKKQANEYSAETIESQLPTELSGSSKTSYTNNLIDDLVKLRQSFADIPQTSWEKETAQIFGCVFDCKKGVLNSQKLVIYRESLHLMGRYLVELKKKGEELSESKGGVTLGLFRKIGEELNRVTQDDRNDEAVHEVGLVKPLFMVMDGFVGSLEKELSGREKKPAKLMRKNSLKKVQQLPAVRPHSRGKLSSLSKKDSGTLAKKEMLGIVTKQKIEQSDSSAIEQVLLPLCSVLKNLSANGLIRRQLLTVQNLRLLNRYLSSYAPSNTSSTSNNILLQLTSSYRHLAVQEKSHKQFLESNSFQSWCRLIQMYPTNHDLIFNLLRTMAKVSNYQGCCKKINEKVGCVKQLSHFFKLYKSSVHIIIRVAIIFANMTSYLTDIRSTIYFQLGAWPDIYACLDYYTTRQLSGKNEIDKMGLTMTAWDIQAMKKESDVDALIRIIKLVANLVTVGQIGQDIYVNDSTSYREMVKKLKTLLQKKCSLDKSSELTVSILTCLTNLLYYDKEILMTNVEYKSVKLQLIACLVDYVVQIDNEEVCCESLRVLANLTRTRENCRAVIDNKIPEALLILVESTCKDIVYYCLGVLANLMTDEEFKQQYRQIVVGSILSILNDCQTDDFDIVTISLKTLACVIDNRNENIDPKIMSEIENCLVNLGGHCDKAMVGVEMGEKGQIMESRGLINLLLNNMPEEKFVCIVKGCGRRFVEEAKLHEHIKRRHKV